MIRYILCLLILVLIIPNYLFASESDIIIDQVNNDERKSVSLIFERYNQLPIKERIDLYYQYKKDSALIYDFENEKELNQYGYTLIFQNSKKDAIEIFKLLVSEFPYSANAYDSLAEGYYMIGDGDNALKNYKISIKFYPFNKHVKHQIKVLSGDYDLLLTDSTWGQEIFIFPIRFAPDIKFVGFEEAMFPGSWGNIESEEFWSYTFAWQIDSTPILTINQLKSNLQLYFDGLMRSVNKDTSFTVPNSSVNLQSNTKLENKTITGSINLYDSFKTKQQFILNVKIDQTLCIATNKLIIVYKFSPKQFDANIWRELDKITLKPNLCN